MGLLALLVDPDVDALGELSASLRARGFTIVLADSVASGLERAKGARPDIVLGAAAVCGQGGLLERLRADGELSSVPSVVLVHARGEGLPPCCVERSDLDAISAAIAAAPSRAAPAEAATQGELRGDVSQVALVDLLQLLGMNRRTGVLSVTTASGAGEIRLADGEVIDAIYRRLEGEKALYRLLGEREGAFAFAPGASSAPRRVNVPSSMLLMEAMRRADEMARLSAELAPGGDALIADAPPEEQAPKLERRIAELLQVPRALDEVLDEIEVPDLELVETMQAMAERGLLRRIPRAALVTALATREKLPMLRALVSRLSREGFSGPPRIAIAAPAPKLAALGRAILRVEEAIPAADPPPPAPVPHLLATLRFGDATDLAVVALPLAPALAPLWLLALPGTAAVVRLDADDAPELDDACAATETPIVHASALLGLVEEGDPAQVAALMRLTLESVAGG